MDDIEMTEHVITIRSWPRDDWDVNKVIFVKANELVEQLRQGGELPQGVRSILHQLTWHCGVHTARWVCDNKTLLAMYADYDALTEEEQKQLRDRFAESVEDSLRRH